MHVCVCIVKLMVETGRESVCVYVYMWVCLCVFVCVGVCVCVYIIQTKDGYILNGLITAANTNKTIT